MEFTINGLKWKIIEVNQEEFWKDDGKEYDGSGTFFGRCLYAKQEIWLWKELSKEQKRKTLIHELIHCYRGSFITFEDFNITEDFMCDIVSNSYDIINEIVKKYFKENKDE